MVDEAKITAASKVLENVPRRDVRQAIEAAEQVAWRDPVHYWPPNGATVLVYSCDGEQFLATFVDYQGQQWVTQTQSGYAMYIEHRRDDPTIVAWQPRPPTPYGGNDAPESTQQPVRAHGSDCR